MLILATICMTIVTFVVLYVVLEDAHNTSLTEMIITLSVVGIPWSYLVGQCIQSII